MGAAGSINTSITSRQESLAKGLTQSQIDEYIFQTMSSKSKKKKKSTKVKKDVKGISSNFSKFEDGQTEVELAQLRENMRELSKQVKEKRHFFFLFFSFFFLLLFFFSFFFFFKYTD